MSTRLRIVLPSVIGVLSVPLILWDIHNARMIESMGLAWDTGAAIWPYQASDIMLRLLNGPAYSIAMPIANLSRLAAPAHLLVVFPTTLIWWWFLGLTLDRGLTRWSLFGMLVVLVALLLWAAATVPAVYRIRFDDRTFHLSTRLLILRFATPAAWFIALTSLLLMRAKRFVLAS